MMIDEALKLSAYCRGFWVRDVRGQLGIAADPSGPLIVSFPDREGIDAWLETQPVMKSQAFLLRRKKRR